MQANWGRLERAGDRERGNRLEASVFTNLQKREAKAQRKFAERGKGSRTGLVKDDSREDCRGQEEEEEGQEEAHQSEGQAHGLLAQDSLPCPEALVHGLHSPRVPQ